MRNGRTLGRIAVDGIEIADSIRELINLVCNSTIVNTISCVRIRFQ